MNHLLSFTEEEIERLRTCVFNEERRLLDLARNEAMYAEPRAAVIAKFEKQAEDVCGLRVALGATETEMPLDHPAKPMIAITLSYSAEYGFRAIKQRDEHAPKCTAIGRTPAEADRKSTR